jgi:phosphoglucomutase
LSCPWNRYDYEGVDSAAAGDLVDRLRAMGLSFREAGFGPANPQPLLDGFSLATIDEFAYTDPIDGSMAQKQGVRFLFADGSRIIVRLSGTGSEGATVRIYIERYQRPGSDEALLAEATTALAPLVSLALKMTMVRELTGRDQPTVIT